MSGGVADIEISEQEKRRSRRWARRQARLDRRHPPRESRLGEAGTCQGAGVDVGCVEAGWTSPPPVGLADGTSIRLFKDGQGLTAALAAIKSAREQVCLETYIFHSDDTGRAFADALCERARAGVRVFVIYDSFGCIDSDPAMFRTMRKAGVNLAEFHPLRPWDATHSWRPLNRDHRKLLVIDNRIAGLGGLNVGSEYGSGFLVARARCCELWRDNAIGVAGPRAAIFAECFAKTWRYCHSGGPIRRAAMSDHVNIDPAEWIHTADTALPQRVGGVRPPKAAARNPDRDRPLTSDFGVLASVPTAKSPLVTFLRNLVRGARYSLDMTIAYFIPSDILFYELLHAAHRGVQVRLMLPGRCDIKIARFAARSFYEPLLLAGVELWERQGAVLHAKTMVIDEQISVIGSVNLDYRSIEFNCELSAVIHNRVFAGQMTRLFQHDAGFAEKILLEQWRRRPWRDRAVQWAASHVRRLL
ncbi:MAG TPA: phospholipase D-like domain-containing protein [Tepidisphaeraceae bacterium]|jgi:cardiolipin synthase|nr:phospholipase D-like domain-containing protein [Tepidisphaeraceae bacterium]